MPPRGSPDGILRERPLPRQRPPDSTPPSASDEVLRWMERQMMRIDDHRAGPDDKPPG